MEGAGPASAWFLTGTIAGVPRNRLRESFILRAFPVTPASMASSVVPKKSGLHGRGLFAARDLEAGVRLIEYTGIRYPKGEYPDLVDAGHTRFVRLSDGTGIDGTGWASLANHACEPNCELAEEEGSDPPRAYLYTLRAVKKGEELVWDYRLEVATRDEAYSDYACACGTPACRGTMADPAQFGAAPALPDEEHEPPVGSHERDGQDPDGEGGDPARRATGTDFYDPQAQPG